MKFIVSIFIITLGSMASYSPAMASDALINKINKLIITSPRYHTEWDQLHIYKEDNPNYGGFIINGAGGDPNWPSITNTLQAVCELKELFPNSITFIDQEGGVARRYKDLDMISAHKAKSLKPEEYKAHILEYSKILKDRCIDVNLAPVINVSSKVPAPFSHPRKIDEKRSYSTDPKIVAEYSKLFADASYEADIIPTAKHFPGDVMIDKIAFDSPYINKKKGHRWEINNISTNYPLKENIDMFFFNRPQFIMWSSNIFTEYSDKPAFMVDEFKSWIDQRKCNCLLVSDALNELTLTDEVILKSFRNSDMVMTYASPTPYIENIIRLIKSGEIKEAEIDFKIKKIDKFKKKANLN